jgi:hypothetical protein
VLPLGVDQEFLYGSAPGGDRADDATSAVRDHHDALRIRQQSLETRAQDARFDGFAGRGLKHLDVLAVRKPSSAYLSFPLSDSCFLYFRNPS